MIKGMTGFGHAQFSNGQVKINVEIKSINHRYLDINYYLPQGLASFEDKLRQIVQKELERGKVTISIRIVKKPGQNIHLNKEVIKTYLKYAQEIKKEFRLTQELSMADLLRFPGVIDVKEDSFDPETLWQPLEKSFRKALQGLVIMRNREGKSLSVDILDKLRRMGLRIKAIEGRQKALLRENKKTLSDEEFQSYQKSNDINEEITRLRHYIDEMKVLFREDASGGKKFDFIAQEMQRETNTIGSKLQDKVVSNAVIALKSKIEKIREQSQNIE